MGELQKGQKGLEEDKQRRKRTWEKEMRNRKNRKRKRPTAEQEAEEEKILRKQEDQREDRDRHRDTQRDRETGEGTKDGGRDVSYEESTLAMDGIDDDRFWIMEKIQTCPLIPAIPSIAVRLLYCLSSQSILWIDHGNAIDR